MGRGEYAEISRVFESDFVRGFVHVNAEGSLCV